MPKITEKWHKILGYFIGHFELYTLITQNVFENYQYPKEIGKKIKPL